MFVDKHRVRMGLVLTHKSVSLSLSLSSCFCSACQCPLWIKVKTSTEVIHVLSLLLLCSAKSPGVLVLLPFQTLFSVYSSLSRSPFPYCWQTELLHSGKCHIIQQRDALCRHALSHTHQSTCSPPSPLSSLSRLSSPAVLSLLTLCFSFVWYWCFLIARIRLCTVCVFVCVCVPALLCFHASLHAVLTHLFWFAFFNECVSLVSTMSLTSEPWPLVLAVSSITLQACPLTTARPACGDAQCYVSVPKNKMDHKWAAETHLKNVPVATFLKNYISCFLQFPKHFQSEISRERH